MTEDKRFTLSEDTEWWFVQDNTIQVNEYGYRDDLTGKDKYRGLKQDLTEQEVVDLLNELNDECEFLKIENKALEDSATKYAELAHKSLKENKQLKAQLYCDSDEGVCTICNHHYLEKRKTYEKYYISKCKKGHEECSKMDLKYCDDFELEEGDEQ